MKTAYIPKILSFWFEEISPKSWFKKDPDFDAKCQSEFGDMVAHALGGRLDSWAADKDGMLALILLLDQMTRNIHRDTPLAFAGDEMAVAFSLRAIHDGYLSDETTPHNLFYLIPLMHSEDLALHHKAAPYFAAHTSEMSVESLRQHTAIIERFGRYPHRNAILGRPSTEEEVQFLTQPGSSF